MLEWKSHAAHPQDIPSETPSDASAREETSPSIEDTSKTSGEGETQPSPISWMEAFRNAIDVLLPKTSRYFLYLV